VDGNVRRTFEKAILNAAFPGDEEVHRLHELQYGQTVRIGEDTYDQGYARGSGSPETSVFNTLLTGLVLFLSMRMLGFEAEEAFSLIGIAAGDDSLQGTPAGFTSGQMARAMERAARQMGQVLTSDIKVIGQPVSFLSRLFGGAWHGDMNSMSCPLRLLSKVHAAVNIGAVSPEDKCRTKGESILPGDANTPIIGDLARKMTTIGRRLEGENAFRLQTWWTKFEDCSWPNEYDSWMNDVIAAEMPDFDYCTFNDWLANGHPLKAPTCFVVSPKDPTRLLLVGDQVLGSSIYSGTSESSVSTDSVKGRNPRRRKNKKSNSSRNSNA